MIVVFDSVSEDKHLRSLKEWNGIRIMNRVDFLAMLDRLESKGP